MTRAIQVSAFLAALTISCQVVFAQERSELYRAMVQMMCTKDTDSVLAVVGLRDMGRVSFHLRAEHVDTGAVSRFDGAPTGAEPYVLSCGLHHQNPGLPSGVYALILEADHPFWGQVVVTHYGSSRRFLSAKKGPLSSSTQEIVSQPVQQPCDGSWWAKTSAAGTCYSPSVLNFASGMCSIETQCNFSGGFPKDASISFLWDGCATNVVTRGCALINCGGTLVQATRCEPSGG